MEWTGLFICLSFELGVFDGVRAAVGLVEEGVDVATRAAHARGRVSYRSRMKKRSQLKWPVPPSGAFSEAKPVRLYKACAASIPVSVSR